MEKGEDTRSIKQRLTATGAEEEEVGEDWRDVDADIEPYDDPSVNFEAPVRERVGGDELSIYLAFTPTDIKNLTTYALQVLSCQRFKLLCSFLLLFKAGR